MSTNRDKQFVFATAISGDGVPFVMIGIPRAAYEELASHEDDRAWGQDADLTKIGVPVRFSIFACDDNAHGRKMIEDMAREANIALDDRRRTDFSIGGTKQ